MTNENWGPALRQLHTVLNAGALGTLADATLLERFLAGRGDDDSAAAFAALVERHGPMVLGVCRNVLRNLHDAEDASQATFLILAKRARLDPPGRLAGELALRGRAAGRGQGEGRSGPKAGDRAARGRDEGTVRRSEDPRGDPCPELYAELDRLPERFRAPIVLCHLEGLTNEQAAGQLGLPVRTVQRRLSQGRERLRSRLVRRGVEPASASSAAGFAATAVSEAWLEATVRAAAGLAAGREIAAVASATVAALTQGVLTMMFVGRLKIVAAVVMAAGAVVVAMVGAGAAIASRRHAEPVDSEGRGRASRVERWCHENGGPSVHRGLGRGSRGWSSTRRAGRSPVPGLFALDSRPHGRDNQGRRDLRHRDQRTEAGQPIVPGDGRRRGAAGDLPVRWSDGLQGPSRALVRIVLRPARAVTVTVVDGRGAPVAGAAVVVLDIVFPVAKGRTDARGIAVLRAPADAIDPVDLSAASPASASTTSRITGASRPVFRRRRSGPARLERHAHRPRPGGRLGGQAGARRRDRADDGPQEGKAQRGQRLRVSRQGSHGRAGGRDVRLAAGRHSRPELPFSVPRRSYSAPKWAMLETDKPDAEVTMRVLRLTPHIGQGHQARRLARGWHPR